MKQVECRRIGNLDIVETHVMTAGARKPRGQPCLLDAPARRGGDDESGGRALLRRQGLAVPADDAMTDDPVRVLAAACERPAPADPIAAIDDLGPAGRCPGSDDHDVRAVCVDLVVGHAWQPRDEELRYRRDHRDPADRTVGGRKRLDQGDDLGHAEFETAMAARHQRPEQAKLAQPLRNVAGKSTRLLDLFGAGAKQRREIADSGQQPCGLACLGLRFDCLVNPFARGLELCRDQECLLEDAAAAICAEEGWYAHEITGSCRTQARWLRMQYSRGRPVKQP